MTKQFVHKARIGLLALLALALFTFSSELLTSKISSPSIVFTCPTLRITLQKNSDNTLVDFFLIESESFEENKKDKFLTTAHFQNFEKSSTLSFNPIIDVKIYPLYTQLCEFSLHARAPPFFRA